MFSDVSNEIAGQFKKKCIRKITQAMRTCPNLFGDLPKRFHSSTKLHDVMVQKTVILVQLVNVNHFQEAKYSAFGHSLNQFGERPSSEANIVLAGQEIVGPGYPSRYSDSIRLGRSRNRIPVGGEILRTL